VSTLVGIIFDGDKHAASEALHRLHKLKEEYLVDLEDAVVVTRREDGKIKLQQSVNLAVSGAWNGAFWGGLLGLIFTGPMGLLVVGGIGAGFGALFGSIEDYGIDDGFIHELTEDIKPCCSALFVLIRKMTEDKVIQELEGLGGKVVKTSLSKEADERLQKALSNNNANQGENHAA